MSARVYGLFRAWQRAGVGARILSDLQGLAEVRHLITWDVSVGSAIARAHQHASGARHDPAGSPDRHDQHLAPALMKQA